MHPCHGVFRQLPKEFFTHYDLSFMNDKMNLYLALKKGMSEALTVNGGAPAGSRASNLQELLPGIDRGIYSEPARSEQISIAVSHILEISFRIALEGRSALKVRSPSKKTVTTALV